MWGDTACANDGEKFRRRIDPRALDSHEDHRQAGSKDPFSPGARESWLLPPHLYLYGWAARVDHRPPLHSRLIHEGSPIPTFSCGPSHMWEGTRPPGRHTQERDGARGRHAGTGKRACKLGLGMRSPRGLVHDEGPRHLGTSQGGLVVEGSEYHRTGTSDGK